MQIIQIAITCYIMKNEKGCTFTFICKLTGYENAEPLFWKSDIMLIFVNEDKQHFEVIFKGKLSLIFFSL